MSNSIDRVIPPREKDLGGFFVRRILPYARHRMVGPFIFFDHMGPAEFAPGQGIEVRPHPHIALATVTYLFEGKIRHRDSLGSDRLIEPGAINWMTAGHGIVHSERAPDDVKKNGGKLNGIQCWVALPDGQEDVKPSFVHYPSKELPEFSEGPVQIKLLVGSAFGRTSPVTTLSDLFYLDVKMPAGSRLEFHPQGREAAAYLVEGSVRVDGVDLEAYNMALADGGERFTLEATRDSRLMLLGGQPLGERYIYWNFVASSEEKIAVAKDAWKPGPGSFRFPKVPGDDKEFIPLPEEPGNPKGTIL